MATGALLKYKQGFTEIYTYVIRNIYSNFLQHEYRKLNTVVV